MSLKERIYSVLIVSSSEQFNSALPDFFSHSKYSPVTVVSNISMAKRAVAERDFDFIVVNSPLPDDSGEAFVIDIVGSTHCVALFMVRAELFEEISDKLAEHGVFLIRRPLSRQALNMAVEWMCSARERLRKTEKKTLSIEEKMNEIRLVNRAKWLLIKELQMDEPSAHRYIEKQAMDRCVQRKEIAEEIIKTYG